MGQPKEDGKPVVTTCLSLEMEQQTAQVVVGNRQILQPSVSICTVIAEGKAEDETDSVMQRGDLSSRLEMMKTEDSMMSFPEPIMFEGEVIPQHEQAFKSYVPRTTAKS